MFVGLIFASSLSAQSSSSLTRIALFEPAGQKSDSALTAVLTTVADSVELSLDVLQRFDVKRLPPADPDTDLPRVRAYCEANHVDQAILGSGSARPEGGYLFKLEVYDRRSDSITLSPEGSSTGALDMFDTTDQLVSTLLDGLSGTHLLFGTLSVETDPAGATVSLNGKEAGTAPLSLRGLPVGTVQLVARAAGHDDASASVTIADGQSTDVPLTLARSTGTFAVTAPKDAVVTVTSAEIGQRQIAGSGSAVLPTGDYDVQASSPGLAAVSAKVTVTRGASTQLLPWPRGYLDVKADPAGATIVVDGVQRGIAPLVVDVDPGTPHHVELTKDNYEPFSADVTAPTAEKTSLAGTLAPMPGGIFVESSIPGVDIHLDETQVATAPHDFTDVPAGPHVIRIEDITVNNHIFTVGGPIQVDVQPGQTTNVSKPFVEAKAHLTIQDAPAGSIVELDGVRIDSVQALTDGIDAPAGAVTVSVTSPDNQKWTSPVSLKPDTSVPLSVHSLGWQLPRRTVTMKGNTDDWAGVPPLWSGVKDVNSWENQPGTQITQGFVCRDDRNLYVRYDFSDGAPRTAISNDFKELDYTQIIYAKGGEVWAITRFARSLFGAAQTTVLGIHNPRTNTLTGVSNNRVAFRIGDKMLEISIPLDLLRPFVTGTPAAVTLSVANADPINNGQWLNYNSTEKRTIDLGL